MKMCVRFLTWYTICCTFFFHPATHYCRNFSFFWLPENIPVAAAASASSSRGKIFFASSRKMWGKNAREKPLRRKSIKGFFLRLLFHIHKFLHSPHRAHLLRCVIKFFFSPFFLFFQPPSFFAHLIPYDIDFCVTLPSVSFFSFGLADCRPTKISYHLILPATEWATITPHCLTFAHFHERKN